MLIIAWGVIYKYFNKEKGAFHTFLAQHLKKKKKVVLVRTAYGCQPLRLPSL